MKCTLIILICLSTITLSFAQNSDRFKRKEYTIYKDSVLINNQAGFFYYETTNKRHTRDLVVKFTLEVINKSHMAIPDIMTARWNDGIKIYINGYNAMTMTLSSFLFGGQKLIDPNASDSFDMDLQLTGAQNAEMGDEFTWQWEYMGIQSSIIHVDVKNVTAKVVDEHLKGGKEFF